MQCVEGPTSGSDNLTCSLDASTVVKIRISKCEMRNKSEIQMFRIQNKCGLVLSFPVFVIEISVI